MDASGSEASLQARMRDLTARGLAQGLDPASPDALNFTEGGQPLVDAAFLAQAVLRAPRTLQRELEAGTRARLIAAFRKRGGRIEVLGNTPLRTHVTSPFRSSPEQRKPPTPVKRRASR